jgi:hypothetical protein
MDYEVLSPWAHVDKADAATMQPRLKDLNGKTIGLFSHFKEHSRRLFLKRWNVN